LHTWVGIIKILLIQFYPLEIYQHAFCIWPASPYLPYLKHYQFLEMIVYRTTKGVLIEHENFFYNIGEDWDNFINWDDVYENINHDLKNFEIIENGEEFLNKNILPPVHNQEVWASGVTYYRSREARMEESKDAGGGDFYDRVYAAERPELFFKSPGYRVVGHQDKVRIRRDSNWNVPEPELTLVLSSSGKLLGYTIGNDMSSRDIEGENPLYLPQAKCYDGSTAIGPGILLTNDPLTSDTEIEINIKRRGEKVFEGSTQINQIKRSFQELVGYLYREMSFPYGCLLMTGTGVVPPDEFTLAEGDEINITIEPIGTLTNIVGL